MSNLSVSGMASLQALNQWISVIDTNLTNTKRIGYKETRVSMTGGIPDSLGTVNTSGKARTIDIPSATLNISNTEIMDKIQGNLTSTGNNTDFALSGQGYFVVEDKFGQRYATRDGQFHFDNSGYLVTQQGLKVLSAGQDWIRVPISEQFSVDNNGRTVSAADMNGLSTSLYGNKKLLVVRLPDNKKLHYSQYGFTTFDIGKFVPVDLNNNFITTMDGINAGQIQTVTARGATFATSTVATDENLFKRDITNGGVNVDISSNKNAQALVSSHTFGDFGNSFTFSLNTANDFSSLGFTFGMDQQALTLSAANASPGTRGYSAGIVQTPAGVRTLAIYDSNNTLIASTGIGSLSASTSSIAANVKTENNSEYQLSLEVVEGKVKLSFSENRYTRVTDLITGVVTVAPIASAAPVILTPAITIPEASYSDKYQSIGVLNTGFANPPSIGGTTLRSTSATANMKLTNLQIKQYGGNEYFDMNVVATKRSNEFDPLANKYNTQWDVVDPDSQENIDTQVRQQYVEESTTTVADTIPLLSNTQKMFSAISKIISIANTITDDVNNLVR